MKILLVEDADEQAFIVEGFVGAAFGEVQVDRAATLGDALKAVRRQNYDAVLLDLGLPDGDGVEVVESVNSLTPDVPILVLTARGKDDLGEACLKAGAEDFLEKKELTPELLEKALRYCLVKREEGLVSELERAIARIQKLFPHPEDHNFSEKFFQAYKKILRRPSLHTSRAHQMLCRSFVAHGASPGQLTALHTQSLEEVALEAPAAKMRRILMASEACLLASSLYLAAGYKALLTEQREA